MTNPKICHSKSLTHLMFCTPYIFYETLMIFPGHSTLSPMEAGHLKRLGSPVVSLHGFPLVGALEHGWIMTDPDHIFLGGIILPIDFHILSGVGLKTTNQDHIFPEIHRGRHFSALNLPGFWRTWNTSSGNMGSTQPSSERRRKTDRYLIDIHIRTCSFELM